MVETIAKSSSEPVRLGPLQRVGTLVVALALLAPLAAAASLTPDPRGHGTHTQLGLYPCTWATTLGWPCPTCGMTTAFSSAAHGQLIRSFQAQPMGLVLALACAMGFWIALHASVTGARTGRQIAHLARPWVWWLVGGLLLAAWGYKIVTWRN